MVAKKRKTQKLKTALKTVTKCKPMLEKDHLEIVYRKSIERR